MSCRSNGLSPAFAADHKCGVHREKYAQSGIPREDTRAAENREAGKAAVSGTPGVTAQEC